MATISGGAGSDDAVLGLDASGSLSALLGSRNSVSTWLACSDLGDTARRLTGRRLRGSALVGTDSGPGSDILGWLVKGFGDLSVM